ncbi:cyclin-like protein [Xylogone sp. PMI_703]|nr:cyclin-like protein [Xylogone sp. PMI_703]
MSHISNPLATPDQIYKSSQLSALPIDLQESIRFYTARLTQAAGILLRVPQDVIAQANVILFRYWLMEDLLKHEFSDVSAATIYLTAKISASPRSLRSVTNVYAYLTSPGSALNSTVDSKKQPPDPTTYYLSESTYITFRNRILLIEGHILNAIGFNTHVALPHPLAITYLQTLDVFSSGGGKQGSKVARRAIEYLNTALLSPQMLYLTHQPFALATAAIYLAARDVGCKLPDCEWWEVFDTEREELGFLVVGMRSLEGLAGKLKDIWGDKGVLRISDVREECERRGVGGDGNAGRVEDEEDEMMRLMDQKVGAT